MVTVVAKAYMEARMNFLIALLGLAQAGLIFLSASTILGAVVTIGDASLRITSIVSLVVGLVTLGLFFPVGVLRRRLRSKSGVAPISDGGRTKDVLLAHLVENFSLLRLFGMQGMERMAKHGASMDQITQARAKVGEMQLRGVYHAVCRHCGETITKGDFTPTNSMFTDRCQYNLPTHHEWVIAKVHMKCTYCNATTLGKNLPYESGRNPSTRCLQSPTGHHYWS